MIIVAKLLAVLMAAIAISKTFYDYKKHQENIFTFLFWAVSWLAIVYVTLSPNTFYRFVESLANENIGVGTLVGIAFVFLFFITYRIYTKANRLEQKIKDIVMRIGIKDINE